MVILLNCVTLGMYQPCENIDCTSDRCQILQVRQTLELQYQRGVTVVIRYKYTAGPLHLLFTVVHTYCSYCLMEPTV